MHNLGLSIEFMNNFMGCFLELLALCDLSGPYWLPEASFFQSFGHLSGTLDTLLFSMFLGTAAAS